MAKTSRAPLFEVCWEDKALYQQALQAANGDPDEVTPDMYYRSEDACTLLAARAKFKSHRRRGEYCCIKKRINVHWVPIYEQVDWTVYDVGTWEWSDDEIIEDA